MKVFILNGPNLNLLGTREPDIYGTTTLAEIESMCQGWAKQRDQVVDFRQSNHEGVLIDAVHEARRSAAALVINPAGFTFTSIALLDALKAFDKPKVEVHLANIHRREEIYHHSLVSKTATAVICGFGPLGYQMALEAIAAWTGVPS